MDQLLNELKEKEMADYARPDCPICGHPMRRFRTGRRLRSGRTVETTWICPVSEAETVKDERGHLSRIDGAVHPFERIWSDSALIALSRKAQSEGDEK